MNNVEFRPLTVPRTLAAADAADFVAMAEVRNDIYREVNGTEDETMTAAELLPHWQPTPDRINLGWLVVAAGRTIGRVCVDIPLEKGSRSAYWQIELRRAHWGRGIGTKAHSLVVRTAHDHGRTLLQSWAQHIEPDGALGGGEASSDRLSSPTGFGTLPRDHTARFYLRHGYELGQIDRKSVLSLDRARPFLERMQAEARPEGYSLVHWTLPTPERHRDAYARMKSRMSTDMPSGEMEFDEESWDAERVVRHDRAWLDGGHTVLVAAARHDATGELVGFTELSIGADKTSVTGQVDTLVVREHRGHKLGQWLKCANLIAWQDIAPGSSRVLTWNAEENRHMLDVNEAMGFVPEAYVGAWRKTLDES